MTTPSMFPDIADPPPGEPEPKLSAGRRLTLRQRADIDRGIHPLTRDALAGNDETCGTCRFREPDHYPKCLWRQPGVSGYPFHTFGAATDCRAWWPACNRWEPKP